MGIIQAHQVLTSVNIISGNNNPWCSKMNAGPGKLGNVQLPFVPFTRCLILARLERQFLICRTDIIISTTKKSCEIRYNV